VASQKRDRFSFPAKSESLADAATTAVTSSQNPIAKQAASGKNAAEKMTAQKNAL